VTGFEQKSEKLFVFDFELLLFYRLPYSGDKSILLICTRLFDGSFIFFHKEMSLIINNLSKKYDNNWVIKDVSLQVEKGEILGLFGVVAEGKTTVIRVLAGVEPLNDGTIFYNSEDLTSRDCDERGFNFPKLTNDEFWKSMFNTQKSSQLADGEGQV
jgi:ABC-type multidrug transport system fused ATPase/permease subunit